MKKHNLLLGPYDFAVVIRCDADGDTTHELFLPNQDPLPERGAKNFTRLAFLLGDHPDVARIKAEIDDIMWEGIHGEREEG